MEGTCLWLRSLPAALCRDVSSVEVLMNYHQGLKTELEARVPELTTCQELGRSLLLNKSAMADEVGRAGGRGWGEGGPSPPAWAHWGWSPSFPHVLPLTHCCQIQAQLDKLGTRKEEVSDKWDRHWEWLQQSEWGPRHTGLKDTGPSTDTSGQGPEDDMSLFCTPPVDAQKRTQGPGGGVALIRGLPCH
jgi:hypothetical protein